MSQAMRQYVVVICRSRIQVETQNVTEGPGVAIVRSTSPCHASTLIDSQCAGRSRHFTNVLTSLWASIAIVLRLPRLLIARGGIGESKVRAFCIIPRACFIGFADTELSHL